MYEDADGNGSYHNALSMFNSCIFRVNILIPLCIVFIIGYESTKQYCSILLFTVGKLENISKSYFVVGSKEKQLGNSRKNESKSSKPQNKVITH